MRGRAYDEDVLKPAGRMLSEVLRSYRMCFLVALLLCEGFVEYRSEGMENRMNGCVMSIERKSW